MNHSTHRFVRRVSICCLLCAGAARLAQANLLLAHRELIVSATEVLCRGLDEEGFSVVVQDGEVRIMPGHGRPMVTVGIPVVGDPHLVCDYPVLVAGFALAMAALAAQPLESTAEALMSLATSQVWLNPHESERFLRELATFRRANREDWDWTAWHWWHATGRTDVLAELVQLFGDAEIVSSTPAQQAMVAEPAARCAAMNAGYEIAVALADHHAAARMDHARETLRRLVTQPPGSERQDAREWAWRILCGAHAPTSVFLTRWGLPEVWPLRAGEQRSVRAEDQALGAWGLARVGDGDAIWFLLLRQLVGLLREVADAGGVDGISPEGSRIAAAFLGVLLRGCFGLDADPKGLRFAPGLPSRPVVRLALHGLRYRAAEMELVVNGTGTGTGNVRIDGLVAAGHVVPATLEGLHRVAVIVGDPFVRSLPIYDRWRVQRPANALPVFSGPAWDATSDAVIGIAAERGGAVLQRFDWAKDKAEPLTPPCSGTYRRVIPVIDGSLYALEDLPLHCLPRAEGRFETVVLGPELNLNGAIHSMSVSADGRVMAVIDANDDLRVARRGVWCWHEAETIPHAPADLQDVALSADGDMVLVLHGRPRRVSATWWLGNRWSVFVEDTSIGEQLPKDVDQLAMSPDELTLVVCGPQKCHQFVYDGNARPGSRLSRVEPYPLATVLDRFDALQPNLRQPNVSWTDLLGDWPDIGSSASRLDRERANALLHMGPVLDGADHTPLRTFYAAKYHLGVRRLLLGSFPVPLIPLTLTDPPQWTLAQTPLLAGTYVRVDPAQGVALLFSLLDRQEEDGRLPVSLDSAGTMRGLAVVDWLAWACWQAVDVSGDYDFLRYAYDALSRWDRWLWGNADSNGNGLLELDGVESVRLNAAAVERAEILAKMADRLGEEPALWAERAQHIRRRVLMLLFDPDVQWFFDRSLDGVLVQRITADGLAALAAGIPSEDQARSMIRLFGGNRSAFGIPVPMPFVPATEPGARTMDAELIWLATRGLERYGCWATANDVRQRWIQTLVRTGLVPIDAISGRAMLPRSDLTTAAVFLDACARTIGALISRDRIVWTAGGPLYGTWMRWTDHWTGGTLQQTSVARNKRTGLVLNGNDIATLPWGVRLVTDRDGVPLQVWGVAPGEREVSIGNLPAVGVSADRGLEWAGQGWMPVEFLKNGKQAERP